MPLRLLAFCRKKPVGRMISSITGSGAAASAAAVGKVFQSVGVTWLTRSSVVWADRMVAHSSWKGVSRMQLAVHVGVELLEPGQDGAHPVGLGRPAGPHRPAGGLGDRLARRPVGLASGSRAAGRPLAGPGRFRPPACGWACPVSNTGRHRQGRAASPILRPGACAMDQDRDERARDRVTAADDDSIPTATGERKRALAAIAVGALGAGRGLGGARGGRQRPQPLPARARLHLRQRARLAPAARATRSCCGTR